MALLLLPPLLSLALLMVRRPPAGLPRARPLLLAKPSPPLATATEAELEIEELLLQLSELRRTDHPSERAPPPPRDSEARLQPAEPTPEAMIPARAAAKAVLAAQHLSKEAKQEALASLCARCLARGRLLSARVVYAQGEARVRRWRALNASAPLVRSLLGAGLSTSIALRDLASYEGTLRLAQTRFEMDLGAEPEPLSSAAAGCCDNGWAAHAHAINLTLTESGVNMSALAADAFLSARLRAGEIDTAIALFKSRRLHGPAPSRATHALAARAVAAKKGHAWGGMRNLMRRKWLRVPWNPHSANAVSLIIITELLIIIRCRGIRTRPTQSP